MANVSLLQRGAIGPDTMLLMGDVYPYSVIRFDITEPITLNTIDLQVSHNGTSGTSVRLQIRKSAGDSAYPAKPSSAAEDFYGQTEWISTAGFETSTTSTANHVRSFPFGSDITLSEAGGYVIVVEFDHQYSGGLLRLHGSTTVVSGGYNYRVRDGGLFTANSTNYSHSYYAVYANIIGPEVAVNTAPSSILLSSTSVSEDAIIGTTVGTLTSNGNDEPLVYSLSGGLADNAAFEISGSQLLVNATLDYETKPSYNIEVSVTDASSNVFAQQFEISVTNVSEPVSDILLSSNSIPENSEIGTVIGTLSAVGDTFPFTFELSGSSPDNMAFAISGNQLVVNASLDYEFQNAYSIQVSVTDGMLNVFQKEFSIYVTDVNENQAPHSLTLSNLTIVENNGVGDLIGSLSATDPDGDLLSFSIIGGPDASSFVVSANQLLANEVFDFESKSSYQVQVRASDSAGLYVDGMFSISVVNSTSDDPVELQSSEVTVLPSGKAVAVVTADPRSVAVTLNGQALPQGSIVKNSVTGQKFMKSAGDEFQFVAIELVPKAEWSWSADGETAWEVLQGF